jgi:hypothetical protein
VVTKPISSRHSSYIPLKSSHRKEYLLRSSAGDVRLHSKDPIIAPKADVVKRRTKELVRGEFCTEGSGIQSNSNLYYRSNSIGKAVYLRKYVVVGLGCLMKC